MMRDLDLFTSPSTVPVCEAQPRDRVAVGGVITDLREGRWVGGVVSLDVTVTEDTGALTVSFLGRHAIAGVELGRSIVVAGAVLRRHGRRTMMNPHLWLQPHK